MLSAVAFNELGLKWGNFLPMNGWNQPWDGLPTAFQITKNPARGGCGQGSSKIFFRELRAIALPARRVFRCAILNSLTVTQPSPMLSATTHLRTLTQNRDNERCGGEAGK